MERGRDGRDGDLSHAPRACAVGSVCILRPSRDLELRHIIPLWNKKVEELLAPLVLSLLVHLVSSFGLFALL